MKIKLYYFGLVSGLSNFSAIIDTITIRIILVIVETKDAATCTIFDIRMVV